jgi:hypothetical protein
MHRKIVSSRLTTCDVINDGEAVRLGLVNQAGCSVSLEMSVEQAESVVMTLPQLLSNALRARTGDAQARYAFMVGQWALESTEAAQCLLVTLKTTDGFEVTFGVPFAQCQALGLALNRHGKAVTEQDPEDGAAAFDGIRALN